MKPPIAPAVAGTPTRPYLIRALHDWCTDNGFTPYLAVYVDARVRVPPEYVKNNEIVLNVGFEATSALKLGNEAIEFKARFGGMSREINVPIDHVIAIYARENGQGMAFPMPTDAGTGQPLPAAVEIAVATTPRAAQLTLTRPAAKPEQKTPEPTDDPPLPGAPARRRVSLKRIK